MDTLSPKSGGNDFDSSLRPRQWSDFLGQDKLKNNIRILVEAAKQRKESPEHILFHGNSGLGKTSLALIIASELKAKIRTITGPAIEKPGDLAAIFTNLEEGEILFIDEIHRLNRSCEEMIYPAMEDFKISFTLGKGPMARTMELDLAKFTLIGATTRAAMISTPLRSRFGAIFQLDFYNDEDIGKIIKRTAGLLKMEIDPPALLEIAKRSRGVPRAANRIMKRVRDFAQILEVKRITRDVALRALDQLEIDEFGLESGDRRIMNTLILKFSGGPAGLQALAAATSEEESNILDIYEPFLMRLGFIERTSRGRVATKIAYEYFGKKSPKRQEKFI